MASLSVTDPKAPKDGARGAEPRYFGELVTLAVIGVATLIGVDMLLDVLPLDTTVAAVVHTAYSIGLVTLTVVWVYRRLEATEQSLQKMASEVEAQQCWSCQAAAAAEPQRPSQSACAASACQA